MKKLALVTLFSLMLPVLAVGDIIVSASPTVTPTGSDFTWSYDVTLSAGGTAIAYPGSTCNIASVATCGAFFTIFDVPGYVLDSASAPTNWGASVQLVGLTSTFEYPATGDSILLPNISFYYTGAPITGPQDLGTFSFQSTFGAEALGSYTQQSNTITQFVKVGGSTEIPAAASVTTPEPSSLTLVLVAAGLFGLAMRRKQFAGRIQQA